jgi:hypothetical protein
MPRMEARAKIRSEASAAADLAKARKYAAIRAASVPRKRPGNRMRVIFAAPAPKPLAANPGNSQPTSAGASSMPAAATNRVSSTVKRVMDDAASHAFFRGPRWNRRAKSGRNVERNAAGPSGRLRKPTTASPAANRSVALPAPKRAAAAISRPNPAMRAASEAREPPASGTRSSWPFSLVFSW